MMGFRGVPRQRWCVIGGGMLGMVLALRLARMGHDVTLKEAGADLGGLAGAWELGSIRWDRFYHVILQSDARLRAVLSELDLDQHIKWRTTRTDFFLGDRLFPMNNAVDFLRFPALSLIDKLRMAATIVLASRISDGRALERIPVGDWLTRLSGRHAYEKIWRPLLRAKLGENHEIASAAFIWAIIQRLYAARRSGLKTEMFGYVPGGYGRIVETLAAELANAGVTIERRDRVIGVARDGRSGLCVRSMRGEDGYDRVAVTVAAPLARQMCPELRSDEQARLDGVVYQGVVCASMLLSRPLNGAYLTYITDPAIPFTAVVEMSALVDRSEFVGRSLVYLPKYLTTNDAWWQLTDGEIQSRFQTGLARIYPDLQPSEILAFRVSRAREVLAVTTLDYSRTLPPMETSVPGLYLLNSAHILNGTLNVDETVGLVERALPTLVGQAKSWRDAA